MRRNSLRINPLAGAIGAEVSDVDLADELGDDTIALIRRAWVLAEERPLSRERYSCPSGSPARRRPVQYNSRSSGAIEGASPARHPPIVNPGSFGR